MHVLAITEPDVQMHFSDQTQLDKLTNDLSEAGIGGNGIWKGAPVYLNLENERIQFNEYVEKITNAHPRDNPGPVQLRVSLKGQSIEIEKRGPIYMDGFVVDFEVVHGKEYLEVTSDKVAKLIISDLSSSDIIIYDEDLNALKVDNEKGEIVV